MIPACELVNEAFRLGGSIVLLLHVDRSPAIDLWLPLRARWLLEEIQGRKPDVVAELKARWLRGLDLRGRIRTS